MDTISLNEEDCPSSSSISHGYSLESIELRDNLEYDADDHECLLKFTSRFINRHIQYELNAKAFQYYLDKVDDSPGPTTYYYLARCYLFGYGIERNLEDAYEFMVSAAQLRHPDALRDLSLLFSCPSTLHHTQTFRTYTVSDYNYKRLKITSLLMSASLGSYNQSLQDLSNLSQFIFWQDMICHLDCIYTNLIDRYFDGDERHLVDLQQIAMRNSKLLQTHSNSDDMIDRIYRDTVLTTENELFQDAKNFSEEIIADICNQLGILRYIKSLQPTEIHHKGELLADALKYFQCAAKLNCAAAYFNIAIYYDEFIHYRHNMTVTKLQVMMEASARGHALAQYELGYHYLNSMSEQEQVQGWLYLMLSSKLGYSDNLYLVGMSYLRDDCRIFDKKNVYLAKTMFKLAIFSLEIPSAKYSKRECFQLGFAYHHSLYLDDVHDSLLYFDRYRLAAHFYAYAIKNHLNFYLPCCYLAKLIEKRRIYPYAIEYIIELYNLAICDDDIAVKGYACYRLGKTYSNQSSGTYYNPSKANEHFANALCHFKKVKDSISGQYHYANMLLQGLGVVRDRSKAIEILSTICNRMRHFGDPYKSYLQSKAERRLSQLIKH
ncbi:uncharacterized protein TRIADDRAFT_51443 [Trichoplax adhaerens]|uniref:Uncharacterized protein n=1 Tax=Trichoplax adhaerens TaxID=10228 RepID=B3RJ82_TRIAD|nr:hypothetical protein TRIADDRAFT_51443 [Trichoplax adhaerens]EDV28487.1 hypothetical protein TRIADDRAFT_51443 [Trichoplax adhaerens]|eukprot:XP_002107689.1 hypothetical protein TRIADDRAFT_51443 [Trichoplax adhaerens]